MQSKSDRLPVIVLYGGTEKLLAVSNLTSGSEKSMALAVKEALNDWKLEDKVVSMSFDTTRSNTAQKNGTCHLFEVQLGKELLLLSYQHHIFELEIGAVFNTAFGPSSESEIKIFKKFQACWPHLKQDNYEPASSEPSMEVYVAPVRDSLLMSPKKFLHPQKPREDYREFLELIIIFLIGVFWLSENLDLSTEHAG